MEFSGTISDASGRCPNVTFVAGGQKIAVDTSTHFDKSKCDDLKNGHSVSGEGTVQSDRTIKATEIQVQK